MRVLSWNCQGTGNPKTVRALKQLVWTNKTDIVFLMETKKLKVKSYNRCHIGDLNDNFFVDCSTSSGGKAGGTGLLWNKDVVNIVIKGYDFNYIDVYVFNFNRNSPTWRATGIYGYPQNQNKFLTCELITNMSNTNSNPAWLVFGDFNITLNNNEKQGGNPIDANIAICFRNTLNVCHLQDLGFHGLPFTWANNHDPKSIIQCRLDRFLATNEWCSLYPNYKNQHPLKFKFDHCPILLECFTSFSCPNRPNKPKRFEQLWLTYEQHKDIIQAQWNHITGNLTTKIQDTLQALHAWGNKKFGIIPAKIRETQNELLRLTTHSDQQIAHNSIQIKEQQLDKLLEQEELWWNLRSRVLWLSNGDKNTQFFHHKENQRRRKNRIEAITDKEGRIVKERHQIEASFLTYFQDIFTSQPTFNIEATTEVMKNKISY